MRSVIGANGLREFIMLPEWTVNYFVSTIKENHFKTLRENYQIPKNIPIRLPYKSEKCYYDGVGGVGVYEQMLKAGLRSPLSFFHRELLKCLGLSVNQVSSECMEDLHSNGDSIWCHERRCQESDGERVPPLLSFG